MAAWMVSMASLEGRLSCGRQGTLPKQHSQRGLHTGCSCLQIVATLQQHQD